MRKTCELKKCDNMLGPGAAKVGFDDRGTNREIKVCSDHAFTIMSAPRGTFVITPDRELKSIPGRRIIT